MKEARNLLRHSSVDSRCGLYSRCAAWRAPHETTTDFAFDLGICKPELQVHRTVIVPTSAASGASTCSERRSLDMRDLTTQGFAHAHVSQRTAAPPHTLQWQPHSHNQNPVLPGLLAHIICRPAMDALKAARLPDLALTLHQSITSTRTAPPPRSA